MLGIKCPDHRRSQHASTSRRVNGTERRSSAAGGGASTAVKEQWTRLWTWRRHPQQRGVNDACCQRAAEFGVAIQTKRRRANSDTVARRTSEWTWHRRQATQKLLNRFRCKLRQRLIKFESRACSLVKSLSTHTQRSTNHLNERADFACVAANEHIHP